MTHAVKVLMVLTGPREGRTEDINGHFFYEGVYQLIGQNDKIWGCIRFLATYGAYPDGSPEYHAACDKYEKIMKEKNGLSNIQENTESGETEKVLCDIQSGGSGSSEEETTEDKSTDKTDEGEKGICPAGDRHEDSGVSTEQKTQSGKSDTQESEKSESPIEGIPELNKKLLKAIMSLDAENDDHWVKTGKNAGKPKITVIEEAYGETGITRIDVESAAPDYDKNAAMEIVISKL